MPAISSTRPDASAVGFPAASRRHALLGGAGVLAVLAIAVPAVAKAAGAGYADTRFVESGGRKLAYRSVGKGKPIVLADGAYTFSVEATRGGAKLTDAAALMFGSVASVSTGAGGVKLNVPGVGSITMADVKQIL